MDKIKKLMRRYYGRNMPVKLLLYNMIVSCGIAAIVVSGALTVLFGNSTVMNIMLMIVGLILALMFFVANRWHHSYNLAAFIIVLLITLVLFPLMFFTGGGIYSGMPCWYILGILFSFLLLDGKICVFTVVLQLIVVIASYIVAYYHPEYLSYMDTKHALFFDIAQSQIIVACVIGIIIKVQNHIFELEREKNIEQQKQLEMALEQAKSASKIKSEFLANVSHEIRTPINAVLGMGEMILRESEESQIKEYASIIKNSGNLLLGIINDILDFSKVESGKVVLNHSQISLSRLVRDLENMIRPRMEAKGLELKLEINPDIPENIIGDDIRLKQVINNILTNAAKYTEHGSVTLNMHKVEAENLPYLYVSVKDTGIGIKKEDLDKLFNSFERVDIEKNRNIEGTGLGLAITQNYIDLMGGGIFVESEYGKGSNFYFMIPLDIVDDEMIGDYEERVRQNGDERNESYQNAFTAPDAQVLVVDDNSTNIMVFASLLKATEIKVDTAASGMECIEKVATHHYDIVFMDHLMPEMDGIETLLKLKEKALDGKLDYPVVALTANAVGDAQRLYMNAGFDAYCSKPIQPDELEQLLINLLPEDKIIQKKEDDISDEELVIKRDMYGYVKESEKYYNSIYISYLKGDYIKCAIYIKKLQEILERIKAEKLYGDAESIVAALKQGDHKYLDSHFNKFLSEYRMLCHNLESKILK